MPSGGERVSWLRQREGGGGVRTGTMLYECIVNNILTSGLRAVLTRHNMSASWFLPPHSLPHSYSHSLMDSSQESLYIQAQSNNFVFI